MYTANISHFIKILLRGGGGIKLQKELIHLCILKLLYNAQLCNVSHKNKILRIINK